MLKINITRKYKAYLGIFFLLPVFLPFLVYIPHTSAQAPQTAEVFCNNSVKLIVRHPATTKALAACVVGADAKTNGVADVATACSSFSNTPEFELDFCQNGYMLRTGQASVIDTACNKDTISTTAGTTATAADVAACKAGFQANAAGTDKATSCQSFSSTGSNPKKFCEIGFDAATAVLGPQPKKDDPDCTKDLDSVLSWVVCPIIDLGAAFTDFVFKDFIQPMLENVPVSTDPTDNSYKAWAAFRLMGNLLLVGTLLAIVYSQAKGGGGR